MPDRRFPPPWEIEDNGACFIVRDLHLFSPLELFAGGSS